MSGRASAGFDRLRPRAASNGQVAVVPASPPGSESAVAPAGTPRPRRQGQPDSVRSPSSENQPRTRNQSRTGSQPRSGSQPRTGIQGRAGSRVRRDSEPRPGNEPDLGSTSHQVSSPRARSLLGLDGPGQVAGQGGAVRPAGPTGSIGRDAHGKRRGRRLIRRLI